LHGSRHSWLRPARGNKGAQHPAPDYLAPGIPPTHLLGRALIPDDSQAGRSARDRPLLIQARSVTGLPGERLRWTWPPPNLHLGKNRGTLLQGSPPSPTGPASPHRGAAAPAPGPDHGAGRVVSTGAVIALCAWAWPGGGAGRFHNGIVGPGPWRRMHIRFITPYRRWSANY
jgi:hypothetical protein